MSVQVTPTSLELHYMSRRCELSSWVVGVIEGAAKLLYNLPHVNVKLLRGRADGTCDHDVSRFYLSCGIDCVYIYGL